MKPRLIAATLLLACASLCPDRAWGFLPPRQAPLPNIDPPEVEAKEAATASQKSAATELRARVPHARVDFDRTTGAPKFVAVADGFLTGPQGRGAAIRPAAFAGLAQDDTDRASKAFLQEHRKLFGFGPEALSKARVNRETVTPHNGLRTVVWEQEVDGIPVFEAVLVAHTTRDGELVNLSSRFVRDATQAAARGTPNRTSLIATPALSAPAAAALAARSLGEEAEAAELTPITGPTGGLQKRQTFRAPFLAGEAHSQLTWLPTDGENLRLCWDLTMSSRRRGEMFRVLVDAETGEVRVRHRLTQYLSDATYNIFTSDSPSPFSPGHATPVSAQPATVSRTIVTLSALNTNASPNGWIEEGTNETIGNNVDAHADQNNDNYPDLPRPQGSPYRLFNFPMDPALQDPTNYTPAAVVQLFYWNNWMHDRLYALGFTEAAGNFQSNNFGRGGLGGDAVQADAQDGGGTDNANFSTPSDGLAGRMQMYLFTGPRPRRDGDLDAEVILHEYTHGLSNRRVGGGVGLSALQSEGMGEGWSDFYALALLSEASDNANACYACGAYAAYQLGGGFATNYYFGIRRYPYTVDRTKNPLTFKDIDPAQASTHPGVPRSSIIGNTANEVHNMGEVWCVTLWEARANLINKLGYAAGNQLILQIVTDGMNLAPPNPTFLQARDAILQAELVNSGGANRAELWAAFAKRGMGFSASSPASNTSSGVVEAFDVPDALTVLPPATLTATGPVGGPFSPNPGYFTLTNDGSGPLTWSLLNTSSWVSVSPTTGVLAPGGPAIAVGVTPNAAVSTFPLGMYPVSLRFSNHTSGAVLSRVYNLAVVGRSLFDDFEPGLDVSQWLSFGGTLGSTVIATNYGGSISSPNSLWFGDAGTRFATTVPINTSGGGTVGFFIRLADGSAWPWETADALPGEGVVLEYSTDGGSSWTIMGSYDTAAYYSWTAVNLSIPAGAQSAATQFRWRQLSHSGSSYDHWALDNVTIDAGPTPPILLTQPADQTVPVGWTASFAVVASGSRPLAYQWRRDESNISGATTDMLVLSNVQSNLAGNYSVVVTNPYGAVTSSPARLLFADRASSIAVFADPDYIDMASGGAGSEGVNVLATLTNLGYQGVPFTNIPSAAANYTVLLFPEQEINNLAPYLSDPDHLALTNFVAQGGLLIVHGGEGGGGSLLNTAFGLAVTESAQAGSGPTYTLTEQAVGTAFAGGPASVPCNNGTSTLTNLPPGGRSLYANLGMSAVASIPYGAGTIVFLGFDWYNAAPIGEQDGGWVQVLDLALLAQAPAAPAITVQPADQTVVVGDQAAFSALARGSMPLSYQWRSHGTNLPGATSSALTLTSVTFDQAGSYSVVVTNTIGSVTSAPATLNVYVPPPPVFTIQPQGTTLPAGTNYILSATVIDAWPLSYQWHFAGQPVAGATRSSLAFTNLQAGQGGDYRVVVANAWNQSTSDVATVTVVPSAPTFVLQPRSSAVFPGLAAQLVASAVGTEPLGYQWRFNGSILDGATGASYTVSNMIPAAAGVYQAIATNSVGQTPSAVVSLTVLAPIGEAVDAPNLVWSTTGQAAWAGQTNVTHDGLDAAQSGLVTDSQSATAQTTISGPGQLRFWWKVSSEEWFDYLTFYIDGVKQTAISGSVDWQQMSYSIAAGSHTLRWTYAKDVSVSVGADAGWLDQVLVVTNPPVFTLHPKGQNGTPATQIMLSGSASGAAPISYQWIKDGTNVAGATTTSYLIPSASRRSSGIYCLLATNPGGGTPSSNANLVVRSPQRLSAPVRLPGGLIGFASADADGGILITDDLPNFQIQATTNFVDWAIVPNGLSLTNGILFITDPQSSSLPLRCYRILEFEGAGWVTNPAAILVHPVGHSASMGQSL